MYSVFMGIINGGQRKKMIPGVSFTLVKTLIIAVMS